MQKITALKAHKALSQHNPLMTQHYSADPYALSYDGRLYIYATGDEPMYKENGELIINNYSNINTIRVISTDDMVNWTDHGEVYAAGARGASTWGGNSWAPAACWKMIDGKPKFFLYFANSGNGIAVLTADSPIGPFTDPLGEALVSRATPTCASVAWLFDPAVLVDDDGCGYLYFGGGIPSPDRIANPGTARVAKLTDDMIHLDGDPVPIENVLYLFEDSGINKINGKYIYSYCSNFNVPAGGCEGFGFGNGEIITMVGDNPMGPFKTVGSVLRNPEYFFSYGGNNHHCMFEHLGKWYITYHASLIEEDIGVKAGYRSVNIDDLTFNPDGSIAVLTGTKEGVAQLKNYDPYKLSSFSTMSHQAGCTVVPADDTAAKFGSGNFNLQVNASGSWIGLTNVDFGSAGASTITFTAKNTSFCTVALRAGSPDSDDLAVVTFDAASDFTERKLVLDKALCGVNSIFFVFDAEDAVLKSWKAE